MSEWHSLTVDFSTAANVAQRQFTSKECPAFKDLMNFTIKHSATIAKVKEPTTRFMGQAKFTQKRFDNFETLVSSVNGSVNESHNWYTNEAGEKIPWLNIAHDGWSGKKIEKLGVTIMFHNPIRKETYSIAIGLCHTDDHKAETVAKATMEILERFGILQSDIC